jgi:hypothetical protein
MVLCIVTGPQVLYHSERLADEKLYAQLEAEALEAAMSYLTGQHRSGKREESGV